MKSFSSVALLLFIAPFLVQSNGPAYRMRRVDITQPEAGQTSSLGRVHGVRPCGGPGRVVEWRLEGCSGDSICQVPTDSSKKSELEFVPSEDIDELGIRINLVENGHPRTVYEKAVTNSAVEGGETYVVNGRAGASKDHKGKTVTIQYILYRVSDNSVEVCSEADFELV